MSREPEYTENKNLKKCPFCDRQAYTIKLFIEVEPDVGLGAGYYHEEIVFGCKACRVWFKKEQDWNRRGRNVSS